MAPLVAEIYPAPWYVPAAIWSAAGIGLLLYVINRRR
jgi:hypothetical protein